MVCELCPRRCLVDRDRQVGYCGQTNEVRVGRAALHFWEEPCISGKEGSGTVFFIGCTLGCVYCQNADISRSCHCGQTATVERLSEIFLELAQQHANNINLVTPTMFSPQIREAVALARNKGLTLPILYNTSGYELPEIIDSLSQTVDIWLPDFKYLSADLSKKYSHAENYAVYAKAALACMVRNTVTRYDDRGMMKSGVIVRHLLLPGQLRESKSVLEYLYGEYGNTVCYSLMSQYTPTVGLNREQYPELARKVTTYEYHKLIEYALSLGITNAFIQDGKAASESFIPSFNGEGV